MEVTSSTDVLVPICQTSRHHYPPDSVSLKQRRDMWRILSVNMAEINGVGWTWMNLKPVLMPNLRHGSTALMETLRHIAAIDDLWDNVYSRACGSACPYVHFLSSIGGPLPVPPPACGMSRALHCCHLWLVQDLCWPVHEAACSRPAVEIWSMSDPQPVPATEQIASLH